MERQLWNENWRFATQSDEFLSAPQEAYQQITLPHDVMIHQKRDHQMFGGVHTAYIPGGSFEYLKTFACPITDPEGQAFLKFDGVYMNAMVYVNQMYVGHHSYGYTPFVVDITPYLNRDRANEVRVVCRNHRDSRWYAGCGIYRNVWLLTAGEVSQKENSLQVTVNAVDRENGEASLHVASTLRNSGKVRHTVNMQISIKDAEGTAVNSIRRTITLFPGKEKRVSVPILAEQAHLWSIEDPYLYRCEVQLTEGDRLLDRAESRFGIRTVSVDAKHGLRLNGESVKLKGTCIHHDNGLLGSAEYRDAAKRRIRLLKEAGHNAIRMSHHPASQEILDACDELGVLVMNEAFDTWVVNKNPYDYGLYFEKDWEQDVTALVESSYNHPSVIMYSLGNEIVECGNPKGAELCRMLHEKIKELDATRPTILSMNILLCMMGSEQEREEPHTMDVNQEITDNQLGFKSIILNPGIAEKVEEALGYADIAGYNYGDSRYLIDKELYPDRVMCGSETFSEDLGANWKLVTENDHIIGDFNWTGWDYIGEVAIGEVKFDGETSPEKSQWKLSHCGDIDILGGRRSASYYRETVWGGAGHPWIQVLDPTHFGKETEQSPWAFFEGLDSWDYPGKEEMQTTVIVYSHAPEVELLVNGISCGRKSAGAEHNDQASYTVTYQPGEIRAIAYEADGTETTWSMESGRGAAHLAVCPEDGEPDAELAYIHIYKKYENGVVCTSAEDAITITVENGELLGFGSARPWGDEAYDSDFCTLYQGHAMAIVRKTDPDKAPEIHVQ